MAVPLFPGVNPYLESPHRWLEIHPALISEIFDALNAVIAPAYRVDIAKRVCRIALPTRCKIVESYVEIKDCATGKIVTVIEVLSFTSKMLAEGRKEYLSIRETLFKSDIHLVEVDLLRQGESMPVPAGQLSDYQILVSRADRRPKIEQYSFGLRDRIPTVSIPLATANKPAANQSTANELAASKTSKTTEPPLDIKTLLGKVCQATGADDDINYCLQPQPPMSAANFDWVRSLPQ